MKVLKANVEQYNLLNEYQHDTSKLIFAVDGAGNYIVGKEVLLDPSFDAINSDLLGLEEIDYIPPALGDL